METKRKYIKSEDFDNIIMRNDYGASVEQIASELDCSSDTIKRVLRAHQVVKDQNWEEAHRIILGGYRLKHLKYFADKMGIELPEEIYTAYEEWKRQEYSSKAKTHEPVQEVIEEYKNPSDKNENLYLCKVLESLAKTNELLEQFMDVVIPKYVIDMKESMNVNADLVTQRLKNCEDRLDKISYNTRKRGM